MKTEAKLTEQDCTLMYNYNRDCYNETNESPQQQSRFKVDAKKVQLSTFFG